MYENTKQVNKDLELLAKLQNGKVNRMINFNNYGIYVDLVRTGSTFVDTSIFKSVEVLDTHFKWIYNILLDGIENDATRTMVVTVGFVDGETVDLSIFDYYINLIFWTMPVSVGDELTSWFLFFDENFTRQSIKKYIDEKVIDKHRTEFSNIALNNIIDDGVYKFALIDDFSMYLMNTINNEDTIDLMKQSEEFKSYLHLDLSGVPLADVKNVGMEYTKKAAEIIMDSDHCLSDSFRTGEGINLKQFKEFLINIGTKPDGNGNIFNAIINASYANGGLQSYLDFVIDDNIAHQSEIYKKKNVGDSGHLSRLVGLNNFTKIYDDVNYACDTRNYIKVEIKNGTILNMYKGRWYKKYPNGPEHKMSAAPLNNDAERSLIGTLLYFRSPMTCASMARGEGVCYKCYGDLAYTNHDINAGKIAAELICSRLTQMLLSAKHLLESKAQPTKWCEAFSTYFNVLVSAVMVNKNVPDSYCLLIDSIENESKYDKNEYDEYVLSFKVLKPDGELIPIFTDDNDNLYITKDLSALIEQDKYKDKDGNIVIPFGDIQNTSLFFVNISNDELSLALKDIKNTLNRVSEIEAQDKDKWIQDMVDRIVDAGIKVDAVHCEVLLANQIRSYDDVLKMPQWEYENEKYQLLTLGQALSKHPNICVSLENERISKTLYNPLTFKKTDPSPYDLFFMEKPQENMNGDTLEVEEELEEKEKINLLTPIEK